jgi:hypothetical protein
MKVRTLITASALTVLTMGSAFAQNAAQIYGSQLMTRQERIEYRNQMRALKTQEERNAFRLEHHNRMQERAKERGLTLPDAPPAQGGGKGRGMGPGMGGMGPGMGGMGPGMGGMGGGRP